MALAEMLDAVNAQLLVSANERMALVGVMDKNAVQGLTVVNTTLIQAQGAVSDDPGLISALQTASRVPIQGANDLAK